MMTSFVISLVDDYSEILSEIHIRSFSDIEIMLGMFLIIRIEWLQDVYKIFFGLDNNVLIVVRDVHITIQFQL